MIPVIDTLPAGGASGWAHVHSITIDHTKAGASNSTGYPMYFGGTFTWLKASGSGGDIQHSTTCCANTETVPADLIFTSDSGCLTQLNWDIPTWVSTTGVIEAFINIPTISSTVDTTIYACTGNSAITTYQTTYTSTYDSNYKGVWHFGDGTTLDLHDSTTNANTCTGVNTPTATTPLLLTGGAISLVASSLQAADCGAGASLNITGALSGEAIAKPFTLPGAGVFPMAFSNLGVSPNNGYELFLHDNSGLSANVFIAQLLNASSASDSPNTFGSVVAANSINMLIMRWGGGTSNLDQINNNTICGFCSNAYTNAIGSSPNHFFIGNRAAVAGVYWNGSLDEIRISNISRSNDWYTTQFNNMNSPSTFFLVVSIR